VSALSGRALGFVGIGRMGAPMCRHLAAAGARLRVFNRTRAAADALAAASPGTPGVIVAGSPREAAEGAEAAFINVSDTAAVEAVLLGESGVLAGLKPGGLVVDMGTTAVTPTRRFAAAVEARGGGYVDAPVSGGVVGAEQGTLSIMVGARDQDFARVKPILERLGRNITHCGGVGAGQVAKIANQMIVGLTIAAVAEAFALSRRAGVDPALVRRAIMGGFAQSRILDLHGERMVTGRFEPGGRARLQRKDIAQALELAGEIGIDLPSTKANLALWDRMIAQGHAELDHSGLYKIYEG
jgi:3-hydroxyisobutyrate dehydrogenase-like beta-hydroxyacid dehydrogenase